MRKININSAAIAALVAMLSGILLCPSAGAQPVAVNYGKTYSGEIAAGDLRLASGQFYDEYVLTGIKGQKLLFCLSSDTVDTLLWLLDSDHNVLQVDDDSGQGTNSVISNFVLPAAGNYYIWATTHSPGEQGTYKLALNRMPAAGLVNALAQDTVLSAELDQGDVKLNSGHYLDYYEFSAGPRVSVTIAMSSAEFDTCLWLINKNGKVITLGNDNKDSSDSQITFVPKVEGMYTLWASSNNANAVGSYDISLNMTSLLEPLTLVPILETIAPIGNGDVVNSTLLADFSQLNTGQLVDVYSFNAVAQQKVGIGLTSSDFDTYLRLFDGMGNLIKNCDDVQITDLTLEKSGTYLIWASSVFAGNTGDYSLSLSLGSALSGDIMGVVTDSCTGKKIGNAKIKTSPSLYFISSGGDGAYALYNIAPRQYTITVSAEGYESKSVTGVSLAANQLKTVDFALMPVAGDTDGDGFNDRCDNCILIGNENQLDTDNDGYGDACDGDFNNDGIINVFDLGTFRSAYMKCRDLHDCDPGADFNGDGKVNSVDLGSFRYLYSRKVPGPSALVPAE